MHWVTDIFKQHPMKDRPLIYLSLALSVASLSYAAWVHYQGSEILAMRALRQRETALVRHWAPRMEMVYRDMLADSTQVPKNPTTLEELFDPLVALLEQVGETGSHTNTTEIK
jgi:hypothetical protein